MGGWAYKWLMGVLALTLVSMVWAEGRDGVLPLPNWEQEEVQIFPLGGGLLPKDGEEPRVGEGNDAGLFIPNRGVGEKGIGVVVEEGVERPLVEVGVDFLQRLDVRAEGEYVLDPAGLVGPGSVEELNRLLATQAEEGQVRPHLILLPEHHRLPQGVDLGKLGRMSEMGGVSCMVVYAMGEPWRVRLFMSRRVSEKVSRDYLSKLAQRCIQDAMKSEHAAEQLKRFVIQLCVRLTWMEREHGWTEREPGLEEDGVGEEMGAEVLEVTAEGGELEVDSVWERRWREVRQWLWVVFALLAVVYGIWRGVRWLLNRVRQREQGVVWMLPEVEVPPRLGGKYCGGGGGSVKY